jgi:hypothetical protein
MMNNPGDADAGTPDRSPAAVSEVRTRRLVVEDERGVERIVAEVVDGGAELRLELGGRTPGRRSMVLLYSLDGDRELGAALGLQLWVDGNVAFECDLWRDLGGAWRRSAPPQTP